MLVIPAIDLIGGKCVRLYQGDYERQMTYAGSPVEQALKFQAARFIRLHVVDLEGARGDSSGNREAIRDILEAVKIPVQVGGGVRDSESVSQLLEWGAQYLILSTVAIQEPAKVNDWIQRWGPECFIVSVDLREGKLQTQGWTEESLLQMDALLERCTDWRIRQLICTDVTRDGTLEQPNYSTYTDLLARLPSETSLMAAGGISSLEQLSRLKEIGVHGAIVGRALYEGKIAWEEVANAG